MLIKLVSKGNDIQLIDIKNVNFGEISDVIKRISGVNDVLIEYIDGENDVIKVCDDESLRNVLKYNGDKVLKLYVKCGNKDECEIKGSLLANNMENRIRKIVDKLDINSIESKKKLISLSIGDPTKYDNLKPSNHVIKTINNVLLSGKYNGYVPSYGLLQTRKAIATKYTYNNGIKINESDVFLSCGCSDALNMSICAILNPSETILLPKPGFSFYETVAQRYGFKCKFYNLLPNNNWDIDINDLEEQIISDKSIKVILVNNPSNPCGSVFSKNNLLNLLNIAHKYNLPIISDEIYNGMVFPGETFYPLGLLSKNVPIITVGGISKQYLVPGWRLGWIILYNVNNKLNNIKKCITNLTTLLLGPNTLIQGGIPNIILNTPNKYYIELNDKLHRNSMALYNELKKLNKYFIPIKPKGAMYLMVKLKIENFNSKYIKDDISFCKLLLNEEAIFVLPGTIFNINNYFRCVTCPPINIMKQVGQRLKIFCKKYDKIVVSKL